MQKYAIRHKKHINAHKIYKIRHKIIAKWGDFVYNVADTDSRDKIRMRTIIGKQKEK